MGICYSSVSRKRTTRPVTENGKVDSKIKRASSSGDFTTFITRLSGGGGGGGAAGFTTAMLMEERTLHQIPGRLFSNGAARFASLYTQQGRKGTNQDAMIFWENFLGGLGETSMFCGVFDGHGPYGHMVARKVRDALPILLRSQWNDKPEIIGVEGMKSFDDFVEEDGCESVEGDEIEKVPEASVPVPETYIPVKRSILKAFKLMDKELKLDPSIDCFCSGTTAVTLIKQDSNLIIGNVGDSRAVLATRSRDNSLVAVQLTVDLKPNLPREAARIQKCKGRVFALQDEPEVARVWLPNSDSPGLAMARAFGDFCLKDFGLISIPDVYHHHISERDEFVILATDGVWDVLSNKEAVDIVASAPSRGTAARALIDCATRAWRLKYPTSKNDDCAVICLFLDHLLRDHAATVATAFSPEKTAKRPAETKSEIVPATEEKEEEEEGGRRTKASTPQSSKRSLAECLSKSEEEEWSALEGVTRVNSLLSLPRRLTASLDRRSSSTSWRKKW
ncbi:hypothetical protein M569_08112, partial [Genlisea aurea]